MQGTQDSWDEVRKRWDEGKVAAESAGGGGDQGNQGKKAGSPITKERMIEVLNTKIAAITSHIRKNPVLLDARPEGERSPSPEPILDELGVRINSRELRTRERLEQERDDLMSKASRLVFADLRKLKAGPAEEKRLDQKKEEELRELQKFLAEYDTTSILAKITKRTMGGGGCSTRENSPDQQTEKEFQKFLAKTNSDGSTADAGSDGSSADAGTSLAKEVTKETGGGALVKP